MRILVLIDATEKSDASRSRSDAGAETHSH